MVVDSGRKFEHGMRIVFTVITEQDRFKSMNEQQQQQTIRKNTLPDKIIQNLGREKRNSQIKVKGVHHD